MVTFIAILFIILAGRLVYFSIFKNGIYEKAGTEASREKYGGTIWFQHNGKDYRLTRETGAGIHNCELFCEDTREF